MPSFFSKVLRRKRDDKEGAGLSPSQVPAGDSGLLGGRFEDVSPSVSPNAFNFPELKGNGDGAENPDEQRTTTTRGRGQEKSNDNALRTFFRSRSRATSPTARNRRRGIRNEEDRVPVPQLPLNICNDANGTQGTGLYDSHLLLPELAIGERKLTPVEAASLVRICSQALTVRGVDTLGIMNPHWYSASPDVQRHLISLFINSLTNQTTTPPLSSTLPSFSAELNSTRSPHDVAAVLRWGLRHIHYDGDFGKDKEWYNAFFDAERKAEYPPKAFSETLAHLIPGAHYDLLKEVFEIFSSLASHAETNSTSGSKLSKMFGLWLLNTHRVESEEDWKSFYARWEITGRQLEHLFFARIRDEAATHRIPVRLRELVNKYPYYHGPSPTTDLRLLPRSKFTTRLYDALFVRIETELPNAKLRPESKVHPLRVVAEALSAVTAEDVGDHAAVWTKIIEASKAEGSSSPLSRVFADDTLRFLTMVPDDNDNEAIKSPTIAFFPLSPSSPRAKRLSFSLSEFTLGELNRTNSSQSQSTAQETPLSPLSSGDWSLFSSAGFSATTPLTPLASTLFGTDVERTLPSATTSRKPSSRRARNASTSSVPKKNVELPEVPKEGQAKAEAAEPNLHLTSKITSLQIIKLDEAFVDFWSDALLDTVSANWPSFVVCRVRPSLASELFTSDAAEGAKRETVQWVVLEQAFVVKPPPASVATPSAAASSSDSHKEIVERERASSPASTGKKRFAFWSTSRTQSLTSLVSPKAKKDAKEARGHRVSEMGEVVEEGSEPLYRSSTSPARKRDSVVRVRVPSPKPRKSTEVPRKSIDAGVAASKASKEGDKPVAVEEKEVDAKVAGEAVIAAAAVSVLHHEGQDKAQAVTEEVNEALPTVDEAKVEAPVVDQSRAGVEANEIKEEPKPPVAEVKAEAENTREITLEDVKDEAPVVVADEEVKVEAPAITVDKEAVKDAPVVEVEANGNAPVSKVAEEVKEDAPVSGTVEESKEEAPVDQVVEEVAVEAPVLAAKADSSAASSAAVVEEVQEEPEAAVIVGEVKEEAPTAAVVEEVQQEALIPTVVDDVLEEPASPVVVDEVKEEVPPPVLEQVEIVPEVAPVVEDAQPEVLSSIEPQEEALTVSSVEGEALRTQILAPQVDDVSELKEDVVTVIEEGPVSRAIVVEEPTEAQASVQDDVPAHDEPAGVLAEVSIKEATEESEQAQTLQDDAANQVLLEQTVTIVGPVGNVSVIPVVQAQVEAASPTIDPPHLEDLGDVVEAELATAVVEEETPCLVDAPATEEGAPIGAEVEAFHVADETPKDDEPTVAAEEALSTNTDEAPEASAHQDGAVEAGGVPVVDLDEGFDASVHQVVEVEKIEPLAVVESHQEPSIAIAPFAEYVQLASGVEESTVDNTPNEDGQKADPIVVPTEPLEEFSEGLDVVVTREDAPSILVGKEGAIVEPEAIPTPTADPSAMAETPAEVSSAEGEATLHTKPLPLSGDTAGSPVKEIEAGPISDLDAAPNYITDPERPTADTEAITNTEGDDFGDLKESVSKEMEIVDSQDYLPDVVDDSLSRDVTSTETPNELTTDDSLIDRPETLTRPQPEPTEFSGSSVSAQAENVEGLVQEVKHLPKESVDSPVGAEKDIVNPEDDVIEQKAGVVVEEVGIVVEEPNPVVEEEDESISLEDPAGAPVEEKASGLVESEQVDEEQAENPSTPEIQGALTPKDGDLDPVTDDAAIAIEQQAAGDGSPEVQVDEYKPEEATPVDEQPESQGQNILVVVEEPEAASQGPTCVVIGTLPEPRSDDVDEARTSTVREEPADPVVKSEPVEPQPAPAEEVAAVFEEQEDVLDRTSVVEEKVETVANEAEAQLPVGIEVEQQVAQEPVVEDEVLSLPTGEGKSDTISEDAVLEVIAPIVEDQTAADDQVKHVLEGETLVIEVPSTDEPESTSTEEPAVPTTEEEVATVGDLVVGGEKVSTTDNEPVTVVSEVGGELASTLKAPPSREPIAAIDDEAIMVQEQLVPVEPEMTFEVEGGKSSVVEPDVAGPVPEDVPSGEQQVSMDPEAAAQSEEGVVEEGLPVIESDVAVEGDDVVEKIEDEITAVVEDREPTASAVANEGDGHILDAEVVVEPEEGTADLQEGHAEVDPVTIDPIEHEREVVVDEGPTPIESGTVKEAEDEDQVERKVEVEAVVAELSSLVQEGGAVVEPHASEQVEEVEEQSAVNPVSVNVAEVGVVAADKSAESEEQTFPSLETQGESQVEGQLQETLVAQEETAIDELGAVEAKSEHPTLHESIIVEDSLYAAVKEPVIEEQLVLVTETPLAQPTTANEQSNFNVEEAPITLEHQVEPTAAASEVVEGGSVVELAEPVLEGQSGVDGGGGETIELAPVDAVHPTEVDTVEESSVIAPDHSLPAIKDEEQNPKVPGSLEAQPNEVETDSSADATIEPSPTTADDLPDIAKDEVQVEAEPTPLDTNRSIDEAANDIPVTIDDSPKPVGDPVEEVMETKETEGASIDQLDNAQVEGAEPVAVVGTTTSELHEETTTETHESPASIKDESATRADSEAAVADSDDHVLEADEAKTLEEGHIAGGPTPAKLDITAATTDEAQQGDLATEEPHLEPSTPQSIDQVELVTELVSTEALSKFTAADSELVDEAVKYPPTVGNAIAIAGKSEGGNVVEVKNGAGQEEAADTVSKEEPAVAPVVQSPVVTDDIPVAASEAPAPEGHLHEIQAASDNNSSEELTVTIEATHEVPEIPPSFTTDGKSTVVEDLVVASEEFPAILGVATTVTDAQSEANLGQEEVIAGGESTQVASGGTVVEEPPSTTLDEDVSGVAEETATQARSEDELVTENAEDEDSSHLLVLVEEKPQGHALEVEANATGGGEDNERASIDDVINDTTHASKTVAVTGPDGAAIDSPPAPMPKDAAIPGTPRILIASATPSIKPINLGPDNEAISLGLVPVENIPLPPPSSSTSSDFPDVIHHSLYETVPVEILSPHEPAPFLTHPKGSDLPEETSQFFNNADGDLASSLKLATAADLPTAIENAVQAGLTPSAEALLDAVQESLLGAFKELEEETDLRNPLPDSPEAETNGELTNKETTVNEDEPVDAHTGHAVEASTGSDATVVSVPSEVGHSRDQTFHDEPLLEGKEEVLAQDIPSSVGKHPFEPSMKEENTQTGEA